MSTVARLIAGIGLNTDDFKKGIGEVSAHTKGIAKEFKALKYAISGAFSIAGVVGYINKLKQVAITTTAAAREAGATTTGYQALSNVMLESALSSEKLSSVMSKLQSAMIQAFGGNIKLIGAFDALGITLADLAGKSTDRVFGIIADAVANTEDQTTAYNAVIDLLGAKLGTSLLPTLKKVGSEGFDNLTDRMRQSGRVMDEIMIARLVEFDTRIKSAGQTVMYYSGLFWDYAAAAVAGYANALTTADKSVGFWENWWRGALAYAENYSEQLNEIVENQEAANAQIGSDIQETLDNATDAVSDAADDIIGSVALTEREIESALDRTNRQWEAVEKARNKYEEVKEQQRVAELSAEQLLQEALARREILLARSLQMEKERNVNSTEWFNLQTDILLVGADIKRLSGEIQQAETDLGATRKKEGAATTRITNEQVEALKNMQNFLRTMTDNELDDFLNILRKLHAGIQGIDFSNLQGLEVLRGFKIPNESVMNANQFGRALAAMAEEIKGLQLPDLQGLEVLKGFKIPNESVLNANQFGRAIKTLVDSIKNQDLNLAPIEKLADLFNAISVGRMELVITPPPRDLLTLTVDAGFQNDIAKLATAASTIASMKGVIYQ